MPTHVSFTPCDNSTPTALHTLEYRYREPVRPTLHDGRDGGVLVADVDDDAAVLTRGGQRQRRRGLHVERRQLERLEHHLRESRALVVLPVRSDGDEHGMLVRCHAQL